VPPTCDGELPWRRKAARTPVSRSPLLPFPFQTVALDHPGQLLSLESDIAITLQSYQSFLNRARSRTRFPVSCLKSRFPFAYAATFVFSQLRKHETIESKLEMVARKERNVTPVFLQRDGGNG
jgi:hypothetical protein